MKGGSCKKKKLLNRFVQHWEYLHSGHAIPMLPFSVKLILFLVELSFLCFLGLLCQFNYGLARQLRFSRSVLFLISCFNCEQALLLNRKILICRRSNIFVRKHSVNIRQFFSKFPNLFRLEKNNVHDSIEFLQNQIVFC